jgi:hypothetical protein
MKRAIFTAVLLIAQIIATHAQDIIYDREDSTFIENIIQELKGNEFPDKGKLILSIADKFIGRQYVAGTLENGTEEPLYISCNKLDCTTFMELVLAIGITIDKNNSSFNDVCNELEMLRYRNGKRRGYTSRLHYISWWIADSAKQGLIDEVTACNLSNSSNLHLTFMSRHPQSYPMLKENPGIIKEIEKLEEPFCGRPIDYIPKRMLDRSKKELPIEDGDILALTTGIEGLDVTHVGFAFWKDGHLHLLHASSGKKEVIRDNETLYNYQAKRKSQTGIRVFRMK